MVVCSGKVVQSFCFKLAGLPVVSYSFFYVFGIGEHLYIAFKIPFFFFYSVDMKTSGAFASTIHIIGSNGKFTKIIEC